MNNRPAFDIEITAGGGGCVEVAAGGGLGSASLVGGLAGDIGGSGVETGAEQPATISTAVSAQTCRRGRPIPVRFSSGFVFQWGFGIGQC